MYTNQSAGLGPHLAEKKSEAAGKFRCFQLTPEVPHWGDEPDGESGFRLAKIPEADANLEGQNCLSKLPRKVKRWKCFGREDVIQ